MLQRDIIRDDATTVCGVESLDVVWDADQVCFVDRSGDPRLIKERISGHRLR